jgi:hypothetical protein
MALRLASCQVITKGSAMIGRIMQIVPYAHRQLDSWNWLDKGDPANAVITEGEEVKAKAIPRLRNEDVSEVNTSTQKMTPVRPTV